ncbi:MAG: ATP-binding protein [Planctomycetes bacterium]|nr:ATP-binding protein [Planctomycetota bacterium]
MARADLLKRLFRAHRDRDDDAFRSVADELVGNELKKRHVVLAKELREILRDDVRSGSYVPATTSHFDPVPYDPDRRIPLVTIRVPDRSFRDLVLATEIRSTLDRIGEEIRNREVLQAYGLHPVRTALFCGPPGCGKTATAEALSNHLGLPLLYVRFDSVVSSLLGETASNLRRVFDYASTGEWVVFFDEFDAVGRSRDDATEHGEIKRVLNAFLQLLDGFSGRSIVVAATNFEQVIDPALWRRFDEILRFDLPSAQSLSLAIEHKLRSLAPNQSTITSLVNQLEGRSFSDAERICVDIRKSCAIEGVGQITPSILRRALERQESRHSALSRSKHDAHPPRIDDR